MYVQVKELAPAVQGALRRVHYGAPDIEVIPAEEVTLTVGGGDGRRGFAIVLNLQTGDSKAFQGSWGGSNMFVSTVVDDSPEIAVLPLNGAVIKGTTGYPRTFATVYAHPQAFGRYLPSSDGEQLTDEEQQALYCHDAVKGGQYRREEMRRRRVTTETVESLIERGYLKKNKAGAVQVTVKGKNARTIRY